MNGPEFGDVGSMSGLRESGHGWAIYDCTRLNLGSPLDLADRLRWSSRAPQSGISL